jgi:5'-3' exonuclease
VVLVFDGDSFIGKSATDNKRHGSIDRGEVERKIQELADQSANGYPVSKTELDKLCSELCKTISRDLFDDIWQDLQQLQREQGSNCKFRMLVAPQEADHQLTFMFREGIINAIVATDTDYMIHLNDLVVVDYKFSRSNGYSGRVFSLPAIAALANRLAGMDDDTKRTEHLQTLTPHSKHKKIPLALFLYSAIHLRGLNALLEFALLVGNDYRRTGVPGVDEVRALKIIADPDGSLIKRTRRQKPKLDKQTLEVFFWQPKICFLHGTVVDEKSYQQRSLSGVVIPNNSKARKKLLGRIEFDPNKVKAHTHNLPGATYSRFKLATMFHPVVAKSKGLTEVQVDAMPLEKAKLQLGARGTAVPATAEKIRHLLRMVALTEKQKHYGPPRIPYPHLLKPNATFVDFEFPDSDDETAGKRKRNNGSKTWAGLGAGDETDGWVLEELAVSMFLPMVTMKSYLGWFQRAWRADMSADNLKKLARPLVKGSQNTANRKVQIHYKDNGDGTVALRCRLLHSFPSKSKNSEHYGYLHPAVLLRTETNDKGYSVATEVLDAFCDCTSQGSKSCWHLAGLLKEAEHLI